MTATAHALIGVAIAAVVRDPLIAIPVALLSHVPCDLMPHWDAGTHFEKKTGGQLFGEGFIDVIISYIAAVVVLIFFFPEVSIFYGLVIAFSAQFLDWITAPYYMFHIHIQPFTAMFRFQKKINYRMDKPWGVLTQASTAIILLILAKLLS